MKSALRIILVQKPFFLVKMKEGESIQDRFKNAGVVSFFRLTKVLIFEIIAIRDGNVQHIQRNVNFQN